MPIPSDSTCALDKLYSKAAQPVARGPHLARETILCAREVFLRAWFPHGKAYHFLANKKV